MKIKVSKIIIIVFGTLTSFLCLADSKIDYSEFDKNTLKEFESVGVYMSFGDGIDVVSDNYVTKSDVNAAATSAAAGLSANTGIGLAAATAATGLAGILITSLIFDGEPDLRLGEELDVYAFPPEGVYARVHFSIFGKDIDWNKEWERLQKITADTAHGSKLFSVLYLEGIEKKYSPRTVISRILKDTKRQDIAPSGAIEFFHSLRFSNDMRKLWYVVDMTAFDVPDIKIINSKRREERYGLIKWLGVTRFAAVHEFTKPFSGDEYDLKNEEILGIVDNLSLEVNEMMNKYFHEDPKYFPGQDSNDMVIVKYPDELHEKTQNLTEALRRAKEKLSTSSERNVYRDKWKRDIKNMEEEKNRFNQMSDEEIKEFIGTAEFKFESTFNLIDRTDTRYRLYRNTKRDYISVPVNVADAVIEPLNKNDKYQKENKLDYSGVSYVSKGLTRLEYGILYSTNEYFRGLGALLLEMERTDKYVLEASATRLWNRMKTEETKNIRILARILGESGDPAFRQILEQVRDGVENSSLKKVLNAEIDKLGKSNVTQFMPNIISGSDDKAYMSNAASEVVKAGLNEGGGRELLYIFRWVRRSTNQDQNLMDDIAKALLRRYRASDKGVVYSLKQYCELLGARPRYRQMFEMLIKRDENFQLKSLLEKVYKKMPKGDVEQFSW